jgi:hypothetical protein
MVSSDSTVPVSSYRIIGGYSDATTHQKIAWINPDNEDVDFRYDGDTNDQVFFCDGSTEVCNFSSTPTVSGTAIDVDGHTHVETDVTNLTHTTDTTCLDTGVICNFAGSASEGGAATSALDLSCTDCVALTSETTGDYVATIAPGVGSKVTVSGTGTEGRAVTLGLSTLTIGTDTTAELDPAACSNANCTVNIGGDTVTGGTPSRCARFDGSGNLVAAGGDCSSGDTTIANTTCNTDTCTLNDDTIVLLDANGAAPTTDGEIKYDRTTERIEVGDGTGTVEFYSGQHTTDTGPVADCVTANHVQTQDGTCLDPATQAELNTHTSQNANVAHGEVDPAACTNAACTVSLANDTVTGGTASRCARFDLSGDLVAASGDCSAGDTTNADQNLFETFDTPSGTNPVADSTTDTLTFSAGTGITISGDSATDTITLTPTLGDSISAAEMADGSHGAFTYSSGVAAINNDSVELTVDTTGNYVATVADAGNATITVGGSGEGAAVTLDAIDLNCTNCLNETEIEDIYLLNKTSESPGTTALTIGQYTINAFEEHDSDADISAYPSSGLSSGMMFTHDKLLAPGTGRDIANVTAGMSTFISSGNIGEYTNLFVLTEANTSGHSSDSVFGIRNELEIPGGVLCNAAPTTGGVLGCAKTASWDFLRHTDDVSTVPADYSVWADYNTLWWSGEHDISGSNNVNRYDVTSAVAAVFDFTGASGNPTRELRKAASLYAGPQNSIYRGWFFEQMGNTTINEFAEVYIQPHGGTGIYGPVFDKYSQLFLASPAYDWNSSSAQPYAIRQEDSGGRLVNTLQSDTTVGGTVTPIATMDIRGFMYLEPQGSPPVPSATCSLGMIYTDTSGALCFCKGGGGTGAWFRLNNGGQCN